MYDLGTEVYYTGDVANQDGFGIITEVTPATRFSDIGYWITLYGQHSQYNCTCGIDGPSKASQESEYCVPARKLHAYECMFEGTGRRFMLKSEYDADKAAKLAQMREQYLEHQKAVE